MDDIADFKLTDDAMTGMGMTDAEKTAIYTLIAGVLHLGNVCFEEPLDDTSGNTEIIFFFKNDEINCIPMHVLSISG